METRRRAKNANFGQPAMLFPIESAELVWLLAYLMWEAEARRGYEIERDHPEHVDLGGEA